MIFKKYLRIIRKNQTIGEKGQSVLEYALLVAIAVTALLVMNFVLDAKEGKFTNHFNTVATYITNQAY